MKREDEYQFCMLGLDTLEVLMLEWEWPNKAGYMGPIIESGPPRWENYCLYADQVDRLIANFKAANTNKGVIIDTNHQFFGMRKYDEILGGVDWPYIGRGHVGDPTVSKYLPELNDPAVSEKLFNDKTRIFLYQADLPVSKKS
jgi:hypothetical protein